MQLKENIMFGNGFWSYAAGVGVLLLVSGGCTSHLDDLKPDPTLAIPIAYGQLSAADIIDTLGVSSRSVRVDNDGLVTLVFSARKQTKKAEEVFVIPDLTVPLLPMMTTYPVPPIQGVQVWGLEVKDGDLRIELQHPSASDVQVVVEIPSLTKGGVPFSFTATANSHGGSVDLDTIVPLNGYTLTVNAPVPTITIQHSVLDLSTQSPVIPQMLKATFTAIRFRYLEFSNVNPIPLEGVTDTLFIDIFDNVKGTEFWAEHPFIDLKLTNWIGGPVRVGFSNIVAYSSASNSSITFVSPWPRLIADLPPAPTPAESSTYYYHIDSSNSNLREVLSALANEIRYSSSVMLLPSAQKRFVLDTSYVEVQAKLEVPLYGYASLILENEKDVTAIAFDSTAIDTAVIYLSLENDFPVGVGMQVFFVDSFGVTFDSLFDAAYTPVISPAVVLLDGTVQQRGRSFLKIPLGRDRVRRLHRLHKVRFRAQLHMADPTYPDKSVKIFEDYTLDVQLSLIVNGRL